MAVVPPGLAPGTPKNRYDYVLLYSQSVTNPSGVVDLASVELEKDERAEIVTCEVVWPSGQPEGKLIPVIDGDVYGGGAQIVLRVGWSSTIVPPTDNQIITDSFPSGAREFFMFGTPRSPDALENTTLKVKSKMAARIVTDGAVTGTVTVRYWGYKYKGPESLAAAYPFGNITFGGSIYDPNTRRMITSVYKSTPVTMDAWDTLPGGVKQEKPIIHPLIRYAMNASDTTPNVPYDFRYATGNVATEDQDMYWDLTPEAKRGFIKITHVGVRAAANLKGWGINVNGELRPDPNWVPATTTYNPYHFGYHYLSLMAGTTAVTGFDFWYPLRRLIEPIYIWREIGRFQIIDNGTAVSANAVTVVVKGVQVIE
jgi:hypothetical protein